MGRPGKIERLPKRLRDELGERYLNGASFSEIAEWINSDADALTRWELHFPGNARLEDHNLSAWKRDGGYARWKEQWAITQLAERCFGIAQASGGHITRGAAAILGGQILAGVEALAATPLSDEDLAEGDDDDGPPKRKSKGREDRLMSLAMALKFTAEAEAMPIKTQLAQGAAKRSQSKVDLDVKKFQRQTCELFLNYCEDQAAKEIALGKQSKDHKIAALVPLFFGHEPEGMGPNLEG